MLRMFSRRLLIILCSLTQDYKHDMEIKHGPPYTLCCTGPWKSGCKQRRWCFKILMKYESLHTEFYKLIFFFDHVWRFAPFENKTKLPTWVSVLFNFLAVSLRFTGSFSSCNSFASPLSLTTFQVIQFSIGFNMLAVSLICVWL